MKIGDELDKAMKAYGNGRGINQAQLARRSGVPQPTISRTLKQTGSIPETKTLKKLANALGCQIGGIFPDNAPAKPSAPSAEQPVNEYRIHNRHVRAVIEMMEGATEEQQVQCVGAIAVLLGCSPPANKNLRRRTGT